MPTDRPILFSAPMIRALLEGRKTQTRRLVKRGWVRDMVDAGMALSFVNDPGNAACLPFQPGDRLWVRETVSLDRDGSRICWWWADGNPEFGDWTRPKPSIHMPRWASRLTLAVTAVKVERLQEISEADARAEGAVLPWLGAPGTEVDDTRTGRTEFAALWKHLHGADAWDANPEVVALSFTVRKGNIDHAE